MATIYDVAKESGFALSTVSNVLNNGPRPVRAETRRRILETVRRLNYHPNAVARGLARRRTNTIGVMFGVVESSAIVINAYSAAILQSVLTVASAEQYDVMHMITPWEGAERSLDAFRDRRADGFLIVAPPTDSDLMAALTSLGMPLVAVSWPPERGNIPAVDVDDVAGAHLIMEHLLGLGHRRIAHLMGHANLISGVTRRDVYLKCITDAGIPLQPEYLLPGSYSEKHGYENTLRLLSLPEPPTAIFAGNDEIAMGALEAARERGVSIPNQLSLVGVDNRPLTSYLTPPLTTLRQPFNEVGEEAARLLLRRVAGEHVPAVTYLFRPELIIRGSTAPPGS